MTSRDMVSDLLKKCFGAEDVADFRVDETEGWEDDQFIKVMIVLKEDAGAFDVEKATNFRRALSSRLDEANLDAFPVVSFRSASDDPHPTNRDAEAA